MQVVRDMTLTDKDFVKVMTGLRLDNKGQWYGFQGNVNGKEVQVKAFGTSIQIYRVDGRSRPSSWNISVKQFNDELLMGVN